MLLCFRRMKLRRTAFSENNKQSVKHEEVEHKQVLCTFRVTSVDINGGRQLRFSICS